MQATTAKQQAEAVDQAAEAETVKAKLPTAYIDIAMGTLAMLRARYDAEYEEETGGSLKSKTGEHNPGQFLN